ncbi:DUF1983 domain-containing protein [Stutzerimonas stutzeri]|uniref:phage tail tip fiber protein n=1 Tax=Stutzerimonas stutzeri TaxID=316 RepID=UPI00244C9BFF|nr:DUF1983 domain-containing protein [Stutzerimonas stutzeri]MDH0100124.1 DUF1983 domain-containing protein [Stutzerimonas stutzeri]MDH0156479.1 DUF1983 domain-containing protein [Stutzerimonas stutzeri]
MTPRRKTLPALSPKAPPELRPLFAAMAEILETGEGVRGDKLDRKLTLRDLLDGGLAKLRVPGNPDGGLTQPDGPQDMTVPPRPTGFAADGSFFGMIHLTWERPQEIYNNHALTNIYRSEEDNFATAQIIGREPGMFYSDVVRDDATVVDDPLSLPGYYYWITFSSTSGVEGAPNSPNGTFAQPLPDAAYLLGQLSGQLGESQLEQDLRARIDLIDGIAPGSVNARIANERTERVEGDKATAQLVTTLQTTVSGNTASIQQQATSINGLSAQFTLKTDVNGYVAGFGAYNDGKTADFAVLADRFWIARPGAPSSAVKPFMVINGMVYIDSAFIRDASIQEGKLGPITFGKLFDSAGRPVTTLAGKLRADMLDVDSLRVGDANIAGVIQSSAVNSLGQRRWILDKNGGLTLNGSSSTGRMEVRDNVIKVFDSTGRLRVQLGDLTA